MATSNVHRWDSTYALGMSRPQPYGGTETYDLGADWLGKCKTVEDWGCGKGYFRTYFEGDRYRGIDGSQTPWADEIADLAEYRSQPDGIFMRHVLEHDPRWSEILTNAVASFQERLVLVLFTPMGEKTEQIAWNDKQGVPDLSFAEFDITDHLGDLDWSRKYVESATQYGGETVFRVER